MRMFTRPYAVPAELITKCLLKAFACSHILSNSSVINPPKSDPSVHAEQKSFSLFQANLPHISERSLTTSQDTHPIIRIPEPFSPPVALPSKDEIQRPFRSYSAEDAAAERIRVRERLQANAELREAGELYGIHKRCCRELNNGRGGDIQGNDKRREDDQCFEPFWSMFVGSIDGGPPGWFVELCADLFLRTNTSSSTEGGHDGCQKLTVTGRDKTDNFDDLAKDSDVANPVRLDVENVEDIEGAVDPYLWLEFNLRAEENYTVGRYVFPTASTYDTETKLKLCQPGGLSTEYVCFCDTYRFPDRRQLPTSVGTIPSKLYVRPDDKTPTVYIQLSDEIPPSLWLPVRPTAAAVRRVLSEFASLATHHRDMHHDRYVELYDRAETILKQSRLPAAPHDILRYAAHEAGAVDFINTPVREFPNYQEFFVGEYDDPTELLEYIQLCPFLFAIPHVRCDVDAHGDGTVPTIDGPGIGASLFRTVYSKSLLWVKVHLGCEVKLPPQDLDGFYHLWKDVKGPVVPASRIPVFIRVVWSDNQRMCGGGRLVERFNALFNTEFSPNIPVDAVMGLYYTMLWSKQLDQFCGVLGMRRKLQVLLEASMHPQPPSLYPSSREIPNPQYTVDERIGMHVQYLAHMCDPDAVEVIKRLAFHGSAPVRMGCAKAAMEAGERELFRSIVSNEPEGRMKHYMTKVVVKRKTRDLTAKTPKIFDDQYEFGAPLWVKGKHIDTNTTIGAMEAERVARTGKIKK